MRWTALLLILPLLAGCAGNAPEDPGWAISATHPLAAQAGAAVLAAGGNAFDAAAAIQFALNVVEPGMSGIGGGAFFVGYVAATGQFVVLDGRETAPAALPPDAFADQGGPPAVSHGMAVGVPGTLALWYEVLARLGTINLADAIAPAVSLAEGGFVVDAYLASYIVAEEEKLRSWPATAEVYFPGSLCLPAPAPYEQAYMLPRCVGGAPLATGQRLVQPDLAGALQAIADNGPQVFYQGAIGDAIVAAVQQRDGVMTQDDLLRYAVVERAPVRMPWDGFDVVTFPAPGGGLIVAQALGILAPFDLAAMGAADRLHVIAETMSLVYADRGAYEADPAFVTQPQAGMLHPDYLAARRGLIDMERTTSHGPGDPWAYEDGPGAQTGDRAAGSDATGDEPAAKEAATDGAAAGDAAGHRAAGNDADVDGPAANGTTADGEAEHHATRRSGGSPSAYEGDHTTHFIVVDAQGNIASVTSTIESVFGSGMIVPGWGFFLNNEMTDFSTDPGAANAPAGGKRARSSMSPTIILDDGVPVMAVGASGGPRIIAGTLQVILNALESGMAPHDAVHAPRIYSPDASALWHEGLADDVAHDLAGRGHAVAAMPGHVANVQAALRVDGQWTAAADDRAGAGAVLAGR